MSPFAAYTAAETRNVFSGPDNYPKLPLNVGGSRTCLLYMVPWAHPSQLPNGISIGSAVFAVYIRVTSTQTYAHRQSDKQTDRHRITA